MPFPSKFGSEDPAAAAAREPDPPPARTRRGRAARAFRIVFVLRDIEGCSVEETATSLALRTETVKTRLHRARRLLRAALNDTLSATLSEAFPFLGSRCERMTAEVMAGSKRGTSSHRTGNPPRDSHPLTRIRHADLALIVFAIAAMGGLFLASHVLRGRLAPWVVSILHALLGATGLVLLVDGVGAGRAPARATAALAVLVLAALGGFYLASIHCAARSHRRWSCSCTPASPSPASWCCSARCWRL